MSQRAATTLHRSPWQGVFLLTGGGSGFLSELLSVPGASATVLDAQIPYAPAALRQTLGTTPDQACSDATARSLAMAAFQRALELTSLDPDAGAEEQQLFGLGCTASLATSRAKRGAHRAHLAIQTASLTFTLKLDLDADRATEERLVIEALWRSLLQALGLAEDGDDTGARVTHASDAWRDLILGDEIAVASVDHDGRLLLPGAFNPLHEGHRRMLAIAEQMTGLTGAYELSVANVDKPFLDYQEIASRLTQFDGPVWLTHLPTFIEKARHFEGATFLIGLDTLLRIADDAYYTSEYAMQEAFREFAELDTRFIVYGRDLETASFKVLEDVAGDLPAELTALCVGIDAATFAEPVSSTSLRRSALQMQKR